jgi:hypothetical protein
VRPKFESRSPKAAGGPCPDDSRSRTTTPAPPQSNVFEIGTPRAQCLHLASYGWNNRILSTDQLYCHIQIHVAQCRAAITIIAPIVYSLFSHHNKPETPTQESLAVTPVSQAAFFDFIDQVSLVSWDVIHPMESSFTMALPFCDGGRESLDRYLGYWIGLMPSARTFNAHGRLQHHDTHSNRDAQFPEALQPYLARGDPASKTWSGRSRYRYCPLHAQASDVRRLRCNGSVRT